MHDYLRWLLTSPPASWCRACASNLAADAGLHRCLAVRDLLDVLDTGLDHEEVLYQLGRHHHPHRTGRTDHGPAFSARMTTANYRQLSCPALAGERGDQPPVTPRIRARSQSAI